MRAVNAMYERQLVSFPVAEKDAEALKVESLDNNSNKQCLLRTEGANHHSNSSHHQQ